MLNDPRSGDFTINPATLELREYKKFFALLGISGIAMYVAMFLNVQSIDDMYFSITGFYKTLLALSLVCILILLFMRSILRNKRLNKIIIKGSVLVFISAFYLLRNQPFITDKQYIEAMIPQHSSAILISRHAGLSDPKLQAVADSIILIQQQRIDKMKDMLNTMN